MNTLARRWTSGLYICVMVALGNGALGAEESITPFTGKVQGNKVRLRLHPSTESQIVRECHPQELFIAVGDEGDFYVIRPPKDIKGYVHRSYILDDIVEANRVNVRLAPNLEAPIITQLAQGQRIYGHIDSANPKWLQIALPKDASLYIAKDYLAKVGDEQYLEKQERDELAAKQLWIKIQQLAALQMEQPFEKIDLSPVLDSVNTLVNRYATNTTLVASAKALVQKLQEEYLKRKVAYLEQQAEQVPAALQQQNRQLINEMASQRAQAEKLQSEIKELKELKQKTLMPLEGEKKILAVRREVLEPEEKVTSSPWHSAEEALFNTWKGEQSDVSWDDFYLVQLRSAKTLRGVIEPYDRKVKNKPGDYLLVEEGTNRPLAYLYSTRVPLQSLVGKRVTIKGSERSNHHFAFSAYFVLSADVGEIPSGVDKKCKHRT